jgi:hypothetical protein
MKRFVFAVAALALAAGPALADPATPAAPPMPATTPAAPPNDTLTVILAHGDSIDVGGMSFDLTFKPDGTFTGGEFAGTYKVDGDNLCITIEGVVNNQCTAYPTGKKSGDSFTIQGDMGPYTVTIH